MVPSLTGIHWLGRVYGVLFLLCCAMDGVLLKGGGFTAYYIRKSSCLSITTKYVMYLGTQGRIQAMSSLLNIGNNI